MSRNLSSKVILISGASSGIGRATALACAWAGMNVSLAARRTDRLQEVARKVSDLNQRAHFFTCDVSDVQQVRAWCNQAFDTLGRVDAVFANAGFGLYGSTIDMPLAQQRLMFDVNYFGTVHTIREAFPFLSQTDDGLRHMLINSSCLSEMGPPTKGAYAATKAAQDVYAQALRAELAGENIFVTTVHPAATESEFRKIATRPREEGQQRTAARPRRRWGVQSSEKVAGKIVAALRRPRAEVWPNPLTRFTLAAATALPGPTAYLLRRLHAKRQG